tara:strand:+ start:7380 stop:9161 length:1782 start_codon:yes stop_codon:yes gene_type:complete
MAIATDIAIDGTGAIYYKGAVHGAAGAGYYTVIELHRFVQDLADDATAAGDDLIDITSTTPSDRSTDNIISILTGYLLDDTNGAATDPITEHLYDGSIIESDGTIYDGIVVIAGEGMDLQIMQNGAQLANDYWNTIPDGQTTAGLNRDSANGISHRFMIEVNTAGTPIDGRRLIGMTRVDFSTDGVDGKTFSEFKINGTARGNNVMALTFANDLNDTSSAAAFSTIANIKEGYNLLDVNNDTVDEAYYSQWNRDTYTINQFYQRMKYLSRGEAANVGTLYGIDAKIFRGITHEVALTDLTTGIWVEPEALSWGTGPTAGTGQLLAVDNTASGSATKLWMQILTGVAPNANTITSATNGATATAGAVVERTISTPFVGVSTGTSLIGSYGFGLETSDLSSTDKVFDLTNTQITPPNNVTFTVSGIVSGEDRVLVGPDTGATALADGQFLVSTAITGASTSLIVKVGTETPGTGTNSATDTPNTGTIRIQEDTTGIFQRVAYTGYTAGTGIMTFTGISGPPIAAINNKVFISYIDTLAGATSVSYSSVYVADRDVFVRVRDAGTAGDGFSIKTFETKGTVGSNGGSTSAIRTSDE